jgi:hypothetical protein
MGVYYHFCHLSHQFHRQTTKDLEEDHDFPALVVGSRQLKNVTYLLT